MNLTTGTTGKQYIPLNNNTLIGTNVRSPATNPSYRDKIERGLDASTWYSRRGFQVRKLSVATSVVEGTSGSNRYRCTGSDTFMNFPTWTVLQSGTTDALLREIALNRLKRRLANETKAFKSLAPLGELREIRGTLRQIADLGMDMLMALAKARKTGGKSLDKFVSETWLGFSFGVAPLVSTVSELGESINAYLTRYDHTIRLTGTASKRWVQASFRDTPAGSGQGTLGANISTSYTVDAYLGYRFVSGLRLALESGNRYGLDDHFGLTIGDVLPAAYELTPWSWLIDYFTTTGAYFEDVFSSRAGSTIYIVECRKYEAEIRTSTAYVPKAGFQSIVNRPGFGSIRVFDFARTPLTSLPHATLRFKTVDEIGANAVTRLLNLAALFTKA